MTGSGIYFFPKQLHIYDIESMVIVPSGLSQGGLYWTRPSLDYYTSVHKYYKMDNYDATRRTK